MAPTTRTRTGSGGPGPSTPQTTPRAPGPSISGPDGTSSTHTGPPPKPRTVQAISISGGVLNNSAIPTLDLPANNYVLWSTAMESHLQFARLYGYVTGTSICPPSDVDPDSYDNWLGNDQSVIGFIRLKCSLEEQKFIRPYKTACTVWQALRTRHENQGAYSQLLVLRELLSTRFPSATAIPTTVAKLDVLLDQFLARELPTGDDFRCLIYMNAMTGSFDTLQSSISQSLAQSTPERPFTSTSIKSQLEFEFKRASDPTSSAQQNAIALVTKGGPKSLSKKFCVNCKSNGHLTDTCWQEGGGMAGRRDEVLAAKRQNRERAKGTSSHSTSQSTQTAQRDTQGRAYLVDSSTGKAYYLTDSSATSTPSSGTSTPSTTTTTEFAGIAADVNLALEAPPAWLHDLSVDGDSQYEMYLALADPFECKVDWTEDAKRAIPPEDLLIETTRTTAFHAIVSPEPFIIDSGATTHISPARSDFSSLTSIKPRSIAGVNGSSINALGIGTVRLRVGRGNMVTLNNVLYVPQASVRLLSVGCLCDGPDKPEVCFLDDSVNVRSRNGTILFTGTRRNGGLYRLDGPTPTINHRAHLAQRLPSLETWHRRLGHANYPAVYDLARRAAAAGMPVDLSSSPPKCEQCILGKQTRTPVPKVREGAEGD
ncbi:hypothetical protein A0H81_12251 [Grifola frondosa]|uniref:Uncharacterized protein n=1 Tax=Grifola frondosa TaxID=5627 RepID=A0A1C7LU80_GRIFR|nr:hypothetical protein A0H81_12251 [Grifola frondosa]